MEVTNEVGTSIGGETKVKKGGKKKILAQGTHRGTGRLDHKKNEDERWEGDEVFH